MRTFAAILLLLLMTGGCGPVGPRYAKLDSSKAKALDLVLVGGGSRVCATAPAAHLQAVVTTTDGKRLETWTPDQERKGKLPLDTLKLSTSYGTIDEEGGLELGQDVLPLLERSIDVTAALADRPEISDSLQLTATFDCGGVVNVSGEDGGPGNPGFRGGTGAAGHQGARGRRGHDGPVVEVALGYLSSKSLGRLVIMRVDEPAEGKTVARMLVTARAGKRFVVIARGGAGGRGGRGGRGGPGSPGRSGGSGRGGNGGDGGHGGRGGNGGNGGDGGRVVIRYDARYPELETMVAVVTVGGAGGAAGPGGEAGPGGPGGSGARGGTPGGDGMSGPPGVAGQPGRDGPPASFVPTPVSELFADELASGLPILR